jgi:hypothetical protein
MARDRTFSHDSPPRTGGRAGGHEAAQLATEAAQRTANSAKAALESATLAEKSAAETAAAARVSDAQPPLTGLSRAVRGARGREELSLSGEAVRGVPRPESTRTSTSSHTVAQSHIANAYRTVGHRQGPRLSQAPEGTGQAQAVEDRLVLLAAMRSPVGVEPVAPPSLGEFGQLEYRDDAPSPSPGEPDV